MSYRCRACRNAYGPNTLPGTCTEASYFCTRCGALLLGTAARSTLLEYLPRLAFFGLSAGGPPLLVRSRTNDGRAMKSAAGSTPEAEGEREG